MFLCVTLDGENEGEGAFFAGLTFRGADVSEGVKQNCLAHQINAGGVRHLNRCFPERNEIFFFAEEHIARRKMKPLCEGVGTRAYKGDIEVDHGVDVLHVKLFSREGEEKVTASDGEIPRGGVEKAVPFRDEINGVGIKGVEGVGKIMALGNEVQRNQVLMCGTAGNHFADVHRIHLKSPLVQYTPFFLLGQ